MKRLMFALAAAAGVALGAYAEVAELIPTQKDYEPAPVSFEAAEYGVPAELPGAYDLDFAEYGDPTESQVKVWYTAAEENPTEVRAYEGATEPTGAGDNFLHVETDAKPLFRTFANALGIGKELGAQYVALDKVAVDTWVKFTAWDSEPAFAADDAAGATKFALWLQTSEDETQTNLFVKCGKVVDMFTSVEPVSVKLDVEGLDLTAWHRVVIKTMLDTTMGEPGLGCFTVAIDGEVPAVANEEDYAKVFPEGTEGLLNEKNAELAEARKLFPSMVKFDDDYAGTLFGVGFQGTGDIDLLSIANYEEPVDVVEFSFKEVEGLKVASVELEDGTVLEEYKVAPGTKVIVTYAPDGNYILSKDTVEYTIEAETVIDPTEKVEVKAAAAKIGAALYLTLKEAFNAAIDNDVIELLADVQLEAPIKVAKKVTLDIGEFDVTPKAAFTRPSGSTETIDAMFVVKYGADFTVEGTTGVIDCSAFPTIYSPIKLTEKGDVFESARAKLTVDANLTGYYYAIVGNGNRPGTDVVVNGGELTAVATDTNIAIYNPQGNSTVVINDGTLTGLDSAIEMRGGTLTVNGGTLTSTAEAFSSAANGDGSTTVGAAVAIAQHTTTLPISATISGGTLTGVYAVSVTNPQKSPEANVAVTLGKATYNGGLFFSADENATVTDNGSGLAAPAGYKWDAEGKLVKIELVTLTIEQVANCTIVVSNNTEEVATGTTFDKDDETELTVYRTPAEGYELDGFDPVETITMSEDVTVTAAVKETQEEAVKPGEPVGLGNPGSMTREEAEAAAAKLPIVIEQADIDAGLTVDAVTVKVELNDGAYQAVLEPKEAPVVDDSVALEVTTENFGATVENPVPGVYYGFVATDTLGTAFEAVGEYVRAKSTDEKLTLTAPKGKGNACFYKLNAALRPPKTTPVE